MENDILISMMKESEIGFCGDRASPEIHISNFGKILCGATIHLDMFVLEVSKSDEICKNCLMQAKNKNLSIDDKIV